MEQMQQVVPEAIMEHSFFFTPLERDHVIAMEVESPEPSLVARLFKPVWQAVSNLIPDTVAPNTICLIGVVLSLQAMQVMQAHAGNPDTRPIATATASLLLLLSTACSAIDGVHAARCRTASVVGRIFTEVCDSAKFVFLLLTVLAALDVKDGITQWYMVMTLQVIRLCHVIIRASTIVVSRKRMTKVSYLFGTSETILFHLCIIVSATFAPIDWKAMFGWLNRETASQIYIATVIIGCTSALLLRSTGTSILPLLYSVLTMAFPAFLLPLTTVGSLSIISDAMVMGVLGVEVFVSAMSSRTIHMAVLFIAILSAFNSVWALSAATLYLAGMILDLSFYSRIPVFVPCRNVYIDGVFDLCHIGHKRLMEFALRHGNRLIVGVMSDEDCMKYKRRPIMSTEERCTEVSHCKYVSQVIPGAPCFGLTKDFVLKHNIHKVVYGEEYNHDKDKYYRVAREMGIGVTAPRTNGISTSEIIARIKKADEAALKAKDKEDKERERMAPDTPVQQKAPNSPVMQRTNSMLDPSEC